MGLSGMRPLASAHALRPAPTLSGLNFGLLDRGGVPRCVGAVRNRCDVRGESLEFGTQVRSVPELVVRNRCEGDLE